MTLTRILRYGVIGDDVWELKLMLFNLGYLKVTPTKRAFGQDTDKAVRDFQRIHKDVNGNPLQVDGIVGWHTIASINKEYQEKPHSTPNYFNYTKQLRRGDTGNDVWSLKLILFSLGYLTVTPTKKYFGDDTVTAVKAFQKSHLDVVGKQLQVDGIVGKLTAAAINDALHTPAEAIITYKDYPNLSMPHINSLNKSLKGISIARLNVIKEILKYAYDDASALPGPQALYCIGANLYDTKLQLFVATEDYLRAQAKKYPSYFTNGRLEWMIKQTKNDIYACADCSGAIIGILRKFSYIKSTADATANTLCSNSYSIAKSKTALIPGDYVGRDGHVGIFVGAGLCVEFAGGAYGCQLTNLDVRKCRNFVDGSLDTLNNWTKYRTPKHYS